jgi:hypothetical protein
VPEMWEQEGLSCAGPRLRGDIKEELTLPHFTFWGRAELTENVFGPTDRKRQPMEEYKNDKLVVRYDPRSLHSCRRMRSRSSVRVQSIEEAVGRRKRRFGGCDHRTGQVLSLGCADL